MKESSMQNYNWFILIIGMIYYIGYPAIGAAANEQQRDECSICQEPIMQEESVLQLRCTHSFHRLCIIPWFYNQHTCPNCRVKIYVRRSGLASRDVKIILRKFRANMRRQVAEQVAQDRLIAQDLNQHMPDRILINDLFTYIAHNDIERVVRMLDSDLLNVHSVDEHGLTALMVAAINGHIEMVLLFIAFGVNIDQIDNDGNTAAMYAARYGHNQIVYILANDAMVYITRDGLIAMSELMY